MITIFRIYLFNFPAKTSRDSGFGSGDPSPIHSRSPSGPSSLDNGHMTSARQYFRSNSSPTANGARSKKKTSKRPSECCLPLFVLCEICHLPVSILRKSISGRHRPVRVADGPMTARCRFTQNASWACAT